MSTFYQKIRPVTPPFDISPDPNGRAQMIFNLEIIKRYSLTLMEDLTKLLTDAGVGTFNTTIFCGRKAQIPTESIGPFLVLIDTGGTSPIETHNEVSLPAYERPSVSVSIRGVTYVAVRAMAYAAFAALNKRNIDVTL